MQRVWLALALLMCSVARGQAPSYSAAGIVNAWSYAPGPFAPNSVVSLFGTNLSMDAGTFTASGGATLPTSLDGVSVVFDGQLAPLLMVWRDATSTQGQINFIVPSSEIPGTVPLWVTRQGMNGPIVNATLVNVTPTLYPWPAATGYATAEDANNNYIPVTPDAPAHAGDTVVVFATGLGAVQSAPGVLQIPAQADQIVNPTGLIVLLNGTAVDPTFIKYAGLTPGSAGLYQINLLVPSNTGIDPQIQIVLGNQSSQTNLKLAVR